MFEGLGIQFKGKDALIGYWKNSIFKGKGIIFYENSGILKGEFARRSYCEGFYQGTNGIMYIGTFVEESPRG